MYVYGACVHVPLSEQLPCSRVSTSESPLWPLCVFAADINAGSTCMLMSS